MATTSSNFSKSCWLLAVNESIKNTNKDTEWYRSRIQRKVLGIDLYSSIDKVEEAYQKISSKWNSSTITKDFIKGSKYLFTVWDFYRTQAEKLQQGSELTRVRLKEMDLPDSILALEGNFSLPVVLKEDVEAVQISGGPSGLDAELQQLKDLRRVNQELLVQTEELLEKEAREDAQFRSQFGTRWTRPQSSTLTKNLQDRLNKLAGNLKQAAESDGRIERAVRDHSALMEILDRRPIESALPTLARPMMSLDANEDAIVGALKQSLRQLETLGAERAGLEDMLKDMRRKGTSPHLPPPGDGRRD